ncbi:hypothetical protein N7456_009638 [Penicillium angulare]|uniref:WW domain-containing protein n=1 Tax=Penicillium angulare TaxID=116970 RepID=A0A9W9F592_9EURO|nr:hypothetical protein N7456_009638 [Penicillium angulare]
MLKSTYTPPPPLPPGWTEHRAPTGHLYYYNTTTKQSTYTRPQIQTAHPVPAAPSYSPETLPPFSSTPYGPAGFQPGGAQHSQNQPEHRHGRGGFRGGKGYQDRGRREPQDRPKSKHVIPDCAPWVLVKTKLGRRFVHNPDTNESLWKFPQEVLKGVIEHDRLEREKKERIERGEEPEEPTKPIAPTEPSKPDVDDTVTKATYTAEEAQEGAEESDEYEEVEVTDSEDEDGQPAKRTRTESEGPGDQPVEFTEEDMEYQLASMNEDYGLDPGEYGDLGEGDWDDERQGLPLTEADADALFRDLLDDFNISPFTTWEKIIEEGRVVEDPRYTAPSNMKARREIFTNWSRDRAKDVQERKKKQEKQDPRIKYFAFLQEYATPKLYWPEFKRKYRKEPEMKDSQLHDKDREKFYREYISKLKAPESTRKSDLSALLKSAPLHALNRSSSVDNLPTLIITDIRYIALPSKIRDPLVEAFVSTLPPAPEEQLTTEQQEELDRKRREREKREKALGEREKRVEEDKRRQRGDLLRGKHLLQEGEAEIAEAMRINKDGLRSHMEVDGAPAVEHDGQS